VAMRRECLALLALQAWLAEAAAVGQTRSATAAFRAPPRCLPGSVGNLRSNRCATPLSSTARTKEATQDQGNVRKKCVQSLHCLCESSAGSHTQHNDAHRVSCLVRRQFSQLDRRVGDAESIRPASGWGAVQLCSGARAAESPCPPKPRTEQMLASGLSRSCYLLC
jgi:hypothetical protein